jgi:antitoxin ParD1/3/4/toxin ParE1/3/4
VTDYSVSRRAVREIEEIIDYIAADNPDAAERVRHAILEAFGRLAKRPGIGHRRVDLTPLPLRFYTVAGRYLVAYRGTSAPIEIVRVFGPGRDVARLLRR